MNAELCINSELSIEIPHNLDYWKQFFLLHAEFCSLGCGKAFQYSMSTRNSVLKFCLMRSIGTYFPLHTEFHCIWICTEFRFVENIFIFLNLFREDFHVCGNAVPIPCMRISTQNKRKMKLFAEILGTDDRKILLKINRLQAVDDIDKLCKFHENLITSADFIA